MFNIMLMKTYVSLCTKLWPDYYYHKRFYEDCFNILPIMLPLFLMLSAAYYAKNYASIIGLSLAMEVATDKSA